MTPERERMIRDMWPLAAKLWLDYPLHTSVRIPEPIQPPGAIRIAPAKAADYVPIAYLEYRRETCNVFNDPSMRAVRVICEGITLTAKVMIL